MPEKFEGKTEEELREMSKVLVLSMKEMKKGGAFKDDLAKAKAGLKEIKSALDVAKASGGKVPVSGERSSHIEIEDDLVCSAAKFILSARQRNLNLFVRF